jgi:hypothetical protein
MSADIEAWLPIAGFGGVYEVSNLGRVRSPRGVLKATPASTGYPTAMLYLDGVRHPRTVHSLVLEAFIGARPEGAVARHLDGSRANNHVDNLQWGTPRENVLDTIRHGRHRGASKTHCDWGHPFNEKNTRIGRNGTRHCRECCRLRSREARGRKRGEVWM